MTSHACTAHDSHSRSQCAGVAAPRRGCTPRLPAPGAMVKFEFHGLGHTLHQERRWSDDGRLSQDDPANVIISEHDAHAEQEGSETDHLAAAEAQLRKVERDAAAESKKKSPKRPKAQPVSAFHVMLTKARITVHHVLHSRPCRIFITTCIILDIFAIMFELLIVQGAFGPPIKYDSYCTPAMFNCSSIDPPRVTAITLAKHDKLLHRVEDGLHAVSIMFLTIFLVEVLLEIFAIGPAYFCSFMHWFDFAVVVSAFFVQILVGKNDLLGVIVVMRVLRIVQGVAETEVTAHRHTYHKYRRTRAHARQLRLYVRKVLLRHSDLIDAPTRRQGVSLMHSTAWQFRPVTAALAARPGSQQPGLPAQQHQGEIDWASGAAPTNLDRAPSLARTRSLAPSALLMRTASIVEAPELGYTHLSQGSLPSIGEAYEYGSDLSEDEDEDISLLTDY